MKETDSTKDEIRAYILSEFLRGESPGDLKDDTPLHTSGVLDSMAALRLVTFVEERFAIEVDAQEVGGESFDCISAIVTYLQRKSGGKDEFVTPTGRALGSSSITISKMSP
jgi:acyl carrier protein